MNPRERVLTALGHKQPDKTPWQLGATDQVRSLLADDYGDPRIAEPAYFDV